MRRNEAKVNCNALTVHTDSLPVILRSAAMVGIAENSADKLKMSRNWARQKNTRRRYLRNGENAGGSTRFEEASSGSSERTTSSVVSGISSSVDSNGSSTFHVSERSIDWTRVDVAL